MAIGEIQQPPQQSNFRWEDCADNGEDFDLLLPPRQVIGPDENGIKKVIDYKSEEGNTVKITTTTRLRTLANARLSKGAIERRSWLKFGDAVHEDLGSRLTMVSTEEIRLERRRAPATRAAVDPLARQEGASLKLCRTCGKRGDHWTAMCPNRDLAARTVRFVDEATPSGPAAPSSGSGKSAYVPPGMRAGAERTGTDMKRRNDENSVRVGNLSEDTREPDLFELFRPFGAVTRAHVAMDKQTGESRGFGFVNFANREDAQKAIDKLDGYGYDNLILKVDWAEPRAK